MRRASAALCVAALLVAACSPRLTRVASPPGPPVPPAPGATATDAAAPIFAGAGDIGTCDSGADKATARILMGIPGTVFAAGDVAYEKGTADEFTRCYDPAWGALKSRTRPVPGNHDWESGLSGYLAYFGAGAVSTGGHPWYSFDLAGWHVVMLDSDCAFVGGCGSGSAEVAWLRQDLAASSARCTIAVFHHPRFSSGEHGDNPDVGPFWDALAAAGADIVINGHDHDYERFAPQRPDGTADPGGIREFVVGTGGKELRGFGNPAPNSEVRIKANGILRLDLRADGYDWSFIDVDGATLDHGTGSCH